MGENHTHKCEIQLLYPKFFKKDEMCPLGFKETYQDECDNCKHFRIINLSDDGLTIESIEKPMGKEDWIKLYKEQGRIKP